MGFPYSSKSGYYKNNIVEFCEFPIWVNTTNHYVNFEKNLCGKYLKTWNDNYEITVNGTFLISIMERVLFQDRNHHGNFQISINAKWRVTHEQEEFPFSTNGFLKENDQFPIFQ